RGHMSSAADQLETDPRFPSGPWTGFFLQKQLPGKHRMELRLTFQNGDLRGEGRDWVGKFTVRGRYSVADGKCDWHKRYVGRHDVRYRGLNEGRGIWGVGEIASDRLRGGSHIGPEGMAAPSEPQLRGEAAPPVVVEELEEVGVTVTPRSRGKRR